LKPPHAFFTNVVLDYKTIMYLTNCLPLAPTSYKKKAEQV